MKGSTRVLIVDDSTFMVRAMREILDSDPNLEVVGAARNGKECLAMIPELKPDVITLDVDMPVMDGLQAVRHIMIESPVPIVMLSSLATHGDITFEALRLGVVDFLPKPSGAVSRDIRDVSHKIIDRVKIATSVSMQNIRRVKLSSDAVFPKLDNRGASQKIEYLVAIGTSLGGPNTVIRLMSSLPPTLPATVVVAQEIAPKILPAFAERFAEYSPWRIEAARQGEILEQGVCYITSIQEPMIIEQNSEGLPQFIASDDIGQPLSALYFSAAQVFAQNTIGVLLTGVGNDGVDGLSNIRANSGVTIVQSTDTCVYPNLTRCAIEKGTADFIVDDNKLAAQIMDVLAMKTH